MINLPPYPLRRSCLRAFAVAIGLAAGLGSWALGAPRAALAVGVGLPVLGALAPWALIPLYFVWLQAVPWVARFCRRCVEAILYFVCLAALGRLGSRVRLRAPGGAAWIPHPDETRVYEEPNARSGTVADFVAFTGRAHEPWAYCLLPFLFLIAACTGQRKQAAIPRDVYTLF
jgi:hypothetical protein